MARCVAQRPVDGARRGCGSRFRRTTQATTAGAGTDLDGADRAPRRTDRAPRRHGRQRSADRTPHPRRAFPGRTRRRRRHPPPARRGCLSRTQPHTRRVASPA